MKNATDPQTMYEISAVKRLLFRVLHNTLERTLTFAPAETGCADATSNDDADIRLQVYGCDVAMALNDLLWRYIDQLESSCHGGWSREEDETVRRVLSVLSDAGWTIRLPRNRL